MLGSSDIWNNPDQAQALNKERVQLEKTIENVSSITQGLKELKELLGIAIEDSDEDTFHELCAEAEKIEHGVHQLEFHRMFCKEMDPNDCYIDFQAGSG